MTKTRLILTAATVLFISACGTSVQEKQDAVLSWYNCTTVEMLKVEAETKWCSDNTGYTTETCYTTAIQRNCTMFAMAPPDLPTSIAKPQP